MTFSGTAHAAVDDDVYGLGQAGRIASLLAMPRPVMITELEMDEAINIGLPVKAYEALIDSIRGSDADWTPAILSPATYQRAKKATGHRLKPEASGQVYEFARVVDGARLVFGKDSDAVRRFFITPNVMLKGRVPVDVALSSPAGADAVIRVLNEARAGVAA